MDGHVRALQLVELKNGETLNGHLTACDNFMNLTIKEVYQTSAVSPLSRSLLQVESVG